MDRIEIKQMDGDQLNASYQPVDLWYLASTSFLIFNIAFASLMFFDVEFSWRGNFDSLYAALAAGLGLGTALYLLMGAVTAYYKEHPQLREMHRFLVATFKNIGWHGIFLLSMLAGIGEELLFRVFFQNVIGDWLGWVAGLLISSLLFGLAHFVSKLYMLMTFLMGLVFGTIYLITDSVLLLMAMHFLYDVCAFVVIVKFPKLMLQPGDN